MQLAMTKDLILLLSPVPFSHKAPPPPLANDVS